MVINILHRIFCIAGVAIILLSFPLTWSHIRRTESKFGTKRILEIIFGSIGALLICISLFINTFIPINPKHPLGFILPEQGNLANCWIGGMIFTLIAVIVPLFWKGAKLQD